MNGPVKRAYRQRVAVKSGADAKNTGFLNTKRRVIYKSAAGKFFSKSGSSMLYNPKAKYHKSPGGTERATKYLKNLMNIPVKIRPKFNRVERKNKGANRKPYAARVKGVRVLPIKRKAYITEMFEGHPAKRGRGRPRKSPVWNLPNPYLRKIRANKGKKRGPRAKKNA